MEQPTHQTLSQYDNAITLTQNSDPNSDTYALSGERFQQSTALLDLILQFGAACTEDTNYYARYHACDFDCVRCQKSIYTILHTKEKFFNSRCKSLCLDTPKTGDLWEMSIVSEDHGDRKYLTLLYLCNHNYEKCSIFDVIYDALTSNGSQFIESISHCYVKIKRFDMEKAMDASTVVNQMIQDRRDAEVANELK